MDKIKIIIFWIWPFALRHVSCDVAWRGSRKGTAEIDWGEWTVGWSLRVKLPENAMPKDPLRRVEGRHVVESDCSRVVTCIFGWVYGMGTEHSV